MNILFIILSILKFLFIALLIIIGIIVLLFAIILLDPIKYKILLKTDDLIAKKADVYALLEVTWLLKILKINFKYKDKKQKIKLSIFGITIIGKEKKDKQIDQIKTLEKNLTEDNSTQEKEESINTAKNSDNKKIMEEEKKEESKSTSNKTKEDKTKEDKIKKDSKEKNKSKDYKTEDFEDHDEHEEKESFKDKSNRIIEKISYFYNYEDKEAIIEATKKLLIRSMKALKPTKFSLTGEFGMDDPSRTGIIIGILSAISNFYRMNISIKGNYQKKIIALKLNVSGQITLGKFMWYMILFVFTKSIFKIIKKFIFKKTERTIKDE